MKETVLTIQKMPLRIIYILLGISLVFSSCLSVKPGTANSAKRLYETFFVGDEGTQYFIKPLSFHSDEHGDLDLDFTFRYKKEIRDSATINMTFRSAEIFKNIDRLILKNQALVILIEETSFMFVDRNKDDYNCRFSTKVPLVELKALFESNDWQLEVYKNGASANYVTPRVTQKKIDKLAHEIFDLF